MAIVGGGGARFVNRGKPIKVAPSIENDDPDTRALMMLLNQGGVPPVSLGVGGVGAMGIIPSFRINPLNPPPPPEPDIDSIVGGAAAGAGVGGQISRSINRDKHRKQPESPDELAAFLSELMDAAMAGQQSFDYEQALQDSSRDITRAFARGVGHIRSQMGKARQDTNLGKKEIDEMYRALSADYAKGAKHATSQGKKGAKAMQFLANEAQRQLTKSANQQIREQAALAKNLGVEVAVPDSAAEQRQGLQEAINRVQERGQRDASDQIQYGRSQQRFLDRGGKNALLEGTNRQGDLVADLQDFLQDSRGSIADLLSQRDQAIAANRAKIIESVTGAQADQSENLFDQLMQIARLKFDIENSRADNALDARKFAASQQGGGSVDSPFPDYMQNYAQIISQSNQPEKLSAVLDELLTSTPFTQGRVQVGPTNENIKLTPYMAANLAEEALRRNGVTNPNDIKLARAAAMQAVSGI